MPARKSNSDTFQMRLVGDLEIEMTREFDAPRELVFLAHSSAEHMKRWWGPRAMEITVCEVDFRVGGKWRIVHRTPDGAEYGFRGEYREIRPHETITWTFEFEGMPGEIGVEVMTLTESKGRTTLRVVSRFSSKDARDGLANSGMEAGAREMWDRLEEHAQTLVQTGAAMSTTRSKVTPFLMFNDGLEQALAFYKATFPGTEVHSAARNGKDGPMSQAEFTVGGQRLMGFNGGPHFKFSEAFSLFVDCENQAEVDRYWDALVKAGATPTQCGWINDPWGLSWQIVPKRFMELISDKDPKKVQAVVAAMLKMVKLDVAGLEAAYNNA